jgi:hypothetical protein
MRKFAKELVASKPNVILAFGAADSRPGTVFRQLGMHPTQIENRSDLADRMIVWHRLIEAKWLAPYYPRLAWPSIDPVLMIRMLIVGYVFGIRSERALCREVQVNLAYRWFCGLSWPQPESRAARAQAEPGTVCGGDQRTYTALFLLQHGKPPLLQVDWLIMPGLIELCAPHLVYALVIGATERHGRSKPNVEIAKIFESAYQFLGIELGAATL